MLPFILLFSSSFESSFVFLNILPFSAQGSGSIADVTFHNEMLVNVNATTWLDISVCTATLVTRITAFIINFRQTHRFLGLLPCLPFVLLGLSKQHQLSS